MSLSMSLPGVAGLVKERLKSALIRARGKGANRNDLVGAVPWEIPNERLETALEDLAREGAALERDGRWYALEHTPFSFGIVEIQKEGDAVVRPPRGAHGGRPGESWFIHPKRLGGALDGDRVLIKPRGRRHRQVQGRRLPEAGVERILERRHERLVGFLETGDEKRRWLIPYDTKLHIDVEVLNADDVPDDEWVVVHLGKAYEGDFVEARIVERLGPSSEPGVDVAVALRHFGIEEPFPDDVMEQTRDYPDDPTPKDWEGREDLRDTVLFTIDGASSQDFDDAVSIERLGKDRFRLGVHIADVAHYVEPDTPLDREAYARGTSVYFPERAVPMLPKSLSNGLCSLRPDVPRLAMSVFMDFDGDGRMTRRRFAETVIRSHRRLTYDEVHQVLEEARPRDAQEYADVLPSLRDMRELAEILLESRKDRGAIDFDVPEGDVILDTDGVVVGITPRKRNIAHRLIEMFMIAANEAVAEELHTREVPALYRVHDPPPVEDLEELRDVIRPLGLHLRGPLEDLPPGELRKILDEVEGRPEEEIVTTLILRTMMRALYDDECRGHYALASRFYTHFTSPIRRYPDLVVHRQLKRLIRLGPKRASEASRDEALPQRLPILGRHTSERERRAESAERDVLQWKKVRFLADRVGERFDGRITGVQPFGLFVRLEDEHVDGLVPIRTLVDDYYVFEPEGQRLIGDNRGRIFRLGDTVDVILEAVDERHRGLNLLIADLANKKKEPRRRGKGRR